MKHVALINIVILSWTVSCFATLRILIFKTCDLLDPSVPVLTYEYLYQGGILTQLVWHLKSELMNKVRYNSPILHFNIEITTIANLYLLQHSLLNRLILYYILTLNFLVLKSFYGFFRIRNSWAGRWFQNITFLVGIVTIHSFKTLNNSSFSKKFCIDF